MNVSDVCVMSVVCVNDENEFFSKLNYFFLYKWLTDIIREDVITIHIQHIKEDSEDTKKFMK